MGRRIEDVTSDEFNALFTSFEHTAYRLEVRQQYDVSYEEEPYRAFIEGRPKPADSSKDAWVGMIMNAVAVGQVIQRVHIVEEPLTDYLRYELDWSYAPNLAAGEDIRILPAETWPPLPRYDYWLFDSSDLWVMDYADDGRFLSVEQVSDPGMIIRHARWRDAALHQAIPYADYMGRADPPRRVS